jgi:hypothetical protein
MAKNSASCNDLLIFGNQKKEEVGEDDEDLARNEVPEGSAADFSIPYNIINNYFSGKT